MNPYGSEGCTCAISCVSDFLPRGLSMAKDGHPSPPRHCCGFVVTILVVNLLLVHVHRQGQRLQGHPTRQYIRYERGCLHRSLILESRINLRTACIMSLLTHIHGFGDVHFRSLHFRRTASRHLGKRTWKAPPPHW